MDDEDNFEEIDNRLQVSMKDGVEIDLNNYNIQNQSAIEERASIEEEDQTSKN